MPYHKKIKTGRKHSGKKNEEQKKHYSLSDFIDIERGFDAYDSFEDMPYELRQSLSRFAGGNIFDNIPTNLFYLRETQFNTPKTR